MPNITNSEAILFCNEYARVEADKRAQAYYFAKVVVNQWTAQGLSSIITNDAEDYLEDSAYGTDGTDGDGRPVITGADVHNMVNRCNDIITDLEASSNAKLNTILALSVNPSA